MWVKDKPRQDITVAARHFRKLRYTGGLLLTRRVASGGKRKKKRKKRPMSRDREDATGTRLTNPWERESSKSICSLRADSLSLFLTKVSPKGKRLERERECVCVCVHVKNRDARRLSKLTMLMRTRILIYILCEAPLDLRL